MSVGLEEDRRKVRDSLSALHFHLICLLIVTMVQVLLNLEQVLWFCSVVVASDPLGSTPVFIHLFACFLCTEGKSWLDF